MFGLRVSGLGFLVCLGFQVSRLGFMGLGLQI